MKIREAVIRMYSTAVQIRFGLARGLVWDRTVRLKGFPIIDAQNGGRIVIGQHVTLNSWNRGSHISMFGPVKLVADRPSSLIKVGPYTRINGSCVHAYSSITIGARCLIAPNCQIFDGNGHDLCLTDPTQRIASTGGSRPIAIDDDVWIGANTIVLPGAIIGRGSVIGAGSVVAGEIPPMCLAAGNPATVRRRA